MRNIRLTIDATETHCGGCPQRDDLDWCDAFGLLMPEHGTYPPLPMRLPECLAAEAADKARDRDAGLGKAARAALGVLDAARCDRIANDAFDGCVFDTDRKGFAQLMRNIAAHLRTEEA